MPEWLIENGIGEDRAILIENDTVMAAKCRWPGELTAGDSLSAKLTRKSGTRGLGELPDGRQLLIDKLPKTASEGAVIPLVVTRGAIAERGRFKLPAARPADLVKDTAPDIFASGTVVRRFPAGLWEQVWDAAWEGSVSFDGGSLLISVTPAMTLIDIDGDRPARELALLAVPAIADALWQFELGGSIGIDFPTLSDKGDRKLVDEALATALADWPHERTAMNGFGFVQIIARLEGPSLLHRMTTQRISAATRMVLRRAEMVDGAGITLITAHPAIEAKIRPEWLDDLTRRTGRPVRVEADPTLAIAGGYAQIIPYE